MFKSVSVLSHNISRAAISAADLRKFEPCGPTGQKSIGFVPPRGTNEALVESIDSGSLLAVMVETKSVPASAIQRELDKAVAAIEQATGRKPGKKERRDLKDEAVLSLLPAAFPKQTRIFVWIAANGLVLIDSTSASKVDDVITLLVSTFDGAEICDVQTVEHPEQLMTNMLIDESGTNFFAGKELALEASDESKAKVRYTNHSLHTSEIMDHIAQGKRPVAMAMVQPDLMSFVLTGGMQLKKIDIDDSVAIASKDTGASDFDAGLLISTKTIMGVIEDVIEDLGGLVSVEGE